LDLGRFSGEISIYPSGVYVKDSLEFWSSFWLNMGGSFPLLWAPFFYGYRLIGATFSLQFDGFYSRLSYSWMILECARGLTSEHLITIVLLTTAPALSYTCFGLKDSAYDTFLHTKKKHGFKPSGR
jgi:hypothetical protein